MSSTLSPSVDPAVLANYPAATPPPGVNHNFANPENHGPDLIVIGSILITVMIACVIGRIYTKARVTRIFSWDDVTCVLAAVRIQGIYLRSILTRHNLLIHILVQLGAIAYFGSCVFAVKQKIGIHQWNVKVKDVGNRNFIVSTYLVSVLVQPTMLCLKLTFFLLYLAIFRPNQALRLCIYGGAVVTTLVYAGFGIAQFIFLTPSRGETWLSHYSKDFYKETIKTEIPVGIFGVVIDFYILLLPIAAVLPLQLPKKRKIGVVLVFLTGFMACICSILSMYYRTLLINDTGDSTWYILPTILLALAEFCIGVIVSCIPHLFSLFRHHRLFIHHLLSSIRLHRLKSSLVRLSPFSKLKSSSRVDSVGKGERDSDEIRKPEQVYLETRILGSSIRGEGRFLHEGEYGGREWGVRSLGGGKAGAMPTHREAWED